MIERIKYPAKWEGHVGCKDDAMRDLGSLVRRAVVIDEDGVAWEHRERMGAVVECPECGEDVGLLQDTDMWTEATDAKGRAYWKHGGYGPVMGECCNLLLADDLESIKAFQLAPPSTEEPSHP